ncbi:MAG: fumarylacetoacetate hydrolase family protein [Methylobacteriaceae bacterium]|nr:fumarylacetoacetate hydrolase family protein [Methylobacteriaceae bacterium]
MSGVIPDLAGEHLSASSLKRVRDAASGDLPKVSGNPRLGPCVGRPGNFIAVGLNYVDHAKETGMPIPAEPILFNKAPNCIAGPNDDIVVPRGSKKMDWEIELGIVIGKRANYINESEVAEHVAGYCLANDVSEREYQLERGGNWMKGKSCPTFGPLGPWLVTPDEIPDVQNLDMWLDVSGQRMQTGSTQTMIFDVKKIVSYISHFMILDPGDVIITGTPPGVGAGMKPPRYLKEGDTIALWMDNLGEQKSKVVGWSKPN